MIDDPAVGCGISKIWLTPPDDVFATACAWHDAAYESGSPEQMLMTRKAVDQSFLKKMLLVAGWNVLLQLRAYLFYRLVRLFGGKYWEGIE